MSLSALQHFYMCPHLKYAAMANVFLALCMHLHPSPIAQASRSGIFFLPFLLPTLPLQLMSSVKCRTVEVIYYNDNYTKSWPTQLATAGSYSHNYFSHVLGRMEIRKCQKEEAEVRQLCVATMCECTPTHTPDPSPFIEIPGIHRLNRNHPIPLIPPGIGGNLLM